MNKETAAVSEEPAEADSGAVSQEQEMSVKNEHDVTNNSEHGSESPAQGSNRAATFEEKQRQLMLADCARLKKRMLIAKNSINRPPLKPFTPYLFNSLEPYYNQYLVNYTMNELKISNEEDGPRPCTNYGQRATSLGIVEPQISWKMDNVPGPYSPSRLSGSLSAQKKCATGHVVSREDDLGSTRLPPFPKPSFPKVTLPEYQPSNMDYSQVLKFRNEMDKEVAKLNKKKVQLDYDRTLKDWERMHLNELKELPPYSRYHVNKAIKTYFGTSKGAVRAVNSLSKQLQVE